MFGFEICLFCFGLGAGRACCDDVGQAKPGSRASASAGPSPSYARALALPTGRFRGVSPPRELLHIIMAPAQCYSSFTLVSVFSQLWFIFSIYLFSVACRPRWGPCMSQEAPSGRVFKLPSFLLGGGPPSSLGCE